jgi:hypothetical protein
MGKPSPRSSLKSRLTLLPNPISSHHRRLRQQNSNTNRDGTNYARVWNEKDQPIFAARAGTYTIVGDKVHETPTIPLDTRQIGADRVLKIIHLDKDTMIVETEDPPELAYPAVEYTYRRID